MSGESPSVLILGATGMLGHAALRVMSEGQGSAWGAVRTVPDAFPCDLRDRLVTRIDALDDASLSVAFDQTRPDVVVNAVGLVKQLSQANDPLAALPINALLPHRLANLCAERGARLIHISTDCVFDGTRGGYSEDDRPDADDLYGLSKRLGEVVDKPQAITLRTSIIGRELTGAHGLIEWFLSQQRSVRGFTRAVFSGLATTELARVIRDVVIPDPDLSGLYQVSSEPIVKHDLLVLAAEIFGKTIEITPDDSLVIDRSLDSTRFRAATGWTPPSWRDQLTALRDSG